MMQMYVTFKNKSGKTIGIVHHPMVFYSQAGIVAHLDLVLKHLGAHSYHIRREIV